MARGSPPAGEASRLLGGRRAKSAEAKPGPIATPRWALSSWGLPRGGDTLSIRMSGRGRTFPMPQSPLAFPAGMVYKALRSQGNSFISGRWPIATGEIAPNLARVLLLGWPSAPVCCLALPGREGPGPGQAAARRRPRPTPQVAPQARPAGRARLLGPAAAAGAAGPVAPDRDPLPDRDRLSAVQLYRRRRQSGRLQRRSRPRAVRGDQGLLHGADAPLRDAGRRARLQPRRCHHRLDGGEPAARAPASISPIPITACRRASSRARTR